MYKGVKFGDIHTSSYELVLSKKTIEAPSPKLETVDVPGADGSLDMTEYFGGVRYNNRKIKLEFSTELSGNELLEMYSNVQNDLHGVRFDSIILDDDKDYRYTGRVVSVSLTESRISRIIIECECEPYKIGINDSTARYLEYSLSQGIDSNFQIDFGKRTVKAKFSVTDPIRKWSLKIDGILYGTYTSLTQTGSAIPVEISGVHDITITVHETDEAFGAFTAVKILIPKTRL